MDTDRKLIEERERRYRDAKRVKQEKELEKQQALLRFHEDRAERRMRHEPAKMASHVNQADQRVLSAEAAAQCSPAATAAEARLHRLSAQQPLLERVASPPGPGQEVGGSAEAHSTASARRGSETPGAQTSSLQIRHVDGQVFKGTFSAVTTLKELRTFVIESSSDTSSCVDSILNADETAQQHDAAGGPADRVRVREAGRRRAARPYNGGGGGSFQGAPKKLSQGTEDGDQEEREVLEQARRAFHQQNSRIVREALQVRGGRAARELKAEDIFFLVPFPRAEFFTEGALSTTVQAAGLCPRGNLVVHLQGGTMQQAGGLGGTFEGHEDEEAAEDMDIEEADFGAHEESDRAAEEQKEERRHVRARALEAAAKRSQEAAAVGQGGRLEMQVETGSHLGQAPTTHAAGLLSRGEGILESNVQGAGRGQGGVAEALMDVDGAGPSPVDGEREERRRRVAEAMSRRLGGQPETASISTGPSQSPRVLVKGKEKVQEPTAPAAVRPPEVEQRLAALRADQAAKAAEKERIQRMLEEDREKRKERLSRQQAGASSSTPPRTVHQFSPPPSQPSARTGAAFNPALNAAAAAVERAAAAKREEQQGPPAGPAPSPLPVSPAIPPPGPPKDAGSARLRIRLEDGSVRMAVFPKEAPMQMVLESGLPEGAQAAEFGLVIPFPEQDFFDEDALSMTIEQAGLAPRGTVHLLPVASRGVVRQATAPWRRYGGRAGPPAFLAPSVHEDEGSEEDEDDEEDGGEDEDEDGLAGGGLGHAPGMAGFGEGYNLTYEQMLRLQERIGHVRQGVPDEILSTLPTRKIHQQTPAALGSGTEDTNGPGSCAVCLCDFQNEDDVTTLPCVHVYHSDCIGKWLRQSKVCPTCKQPVF